MVELEGWDSYKYFLVMVVYLNNGIKAITIKCLKEKNLPYVEHDILIAYASTLVM